MAVTCDRLELPLFVSPYVSEVAERFNTTVKRVEWETHSRRARTEQRGKRRGYRFIKISVEDNYEN